MDEGWSITGKESVVHASRKITLLRHFHTPLFHVYCYCMSRRNCIIALVLIDGALDSGIKKQLLYTGIVRAALPRVALSVWYYGIHGGGYRWRKKTLSNVRSRLILWNELSLGVPGGVVTWSVGKLVVTCCHMLHNSLHNINPTFSHNQLFCLLTCHHLLV